MSANLNTPFPELIRRIKDEGIVQGNDILKIDHFLNHRIEPSFMQRMAKEIALRLRDYKPELILTAEASGIAPGLMVALELDLPLVYAKKYHPEVEVPMLSRVLPSPTKGGSYRMVLSQKYLPEGAKVAIVDDFLSNGRTATALIEMAREARLDVVAASFLVAKTFKQGYREIAAAGVPVVTLADVEALRDGKAIIRES
ncbi:phosphoribosyltransferase family protein [Uliginosibacterium sp. H3]|uniref:Phosphoribosyltransferase family protein n=1 Tax=Uliginosibacterium silvisoli TaxID=3114758 RepID=A0ABU6K835_9RHOO|nr:phosphoribosyltransferase family protein [Uliginosibacterium sp. H3]